MARLKYVSIKKASDYIPNGVYLNEKEILELESKLEALQSDNKKRELAFAEEILSKAKAIKAIRVQFDRQIGQIEKNKEALDKLVDSISSLSTCVVCRDSGSVKIQLNDYLVCSKCGGKNDADAVFCSDCGAEFRGLRKDLCKRTKERAKRAESLKLALAQEAMANAGKNEALRAAVESDQFKLLEENESTWNEIVEEIEKLREPKGGPAEDNAFEYIACGGCGSKQKVSYAICEVCGHPLKAGEAKSACPKCSVLFMNKLAFCMYCGAPTVSVEASPKNLPKTEGAGACPNCGAPSVAGKRFCSRCGTRVNGDEG